MSETRGAMPRQSLLDYFRNDSRPQGEAAVVWRRGYRTVRWTYADLLRAATQFALELGALGIEKGDRVLLWGENSGEWVAAFLGCLFWGAVSVPMDVTADREFAGRVAKQAGVRLAVIGQAFRCPKAASLWLYGGFLRGRGRGGRGSLFASGGRAQRRRRDRVYIGDDS